MGVRPRSIALRLAAGAALVLGTAAGAAAQAGTPKLKYDAQIYAGALTLNKGYKDRKFAGAFFDIYSDDLGVHGDIITVDREERATYASLGLSLPLSPHVRPKFMIGSSTANRAILPEFFGMVEVQIKPGSNSGWVVTPAIAYRSYRNATHETRGSLSVVKYFNVPWDHGGYYAAQGVVTLADNGRTPARASVLGGLQTVRNNGVSLGVNAEIGGVVGNPLVENQVVGTYFAVRPNAAFPLFGKNQLLLRGEYSETDAYRALGGTAGLKFDF